MTGTNYMVRPTARSDSIMRNFEVDSSYGQFQFDGVEFTRMRLREIEAAGALERFRNRRPGLNRLASKWWRR